MGGPFACSTGAAFGALAVCDVLVVHGDFGAISATAGGLVPSHGDDLDYSRSCSLYTRGIFDGYLRRIAVDLVYCWQVKSKSAVTCGLGLDARL